MAEHIELLPETPASLRSTNLWSGFSSSILLLANGMEKAAQECASLWVPPTPTQLGDPDGAVLGSALAIIAMWELNHRMEYLSSAPSLSENK